MPSPAQTLPPSILEPIIEYASGVERAIGHRIGTKLCCLNRSFLPFLAVCRDWRVFSRALFYQEALVLMDDEFLDLHDHTHMLPGLTTAVKAGAAGLVKIAHVELPYSCVLDGAAATLFSSTHFAGTQFSSATQLLVVLNDNMYPRTMDSGTMAENVARFSAAIIRLFPNVWDHLFYIGCYEYAPQRENLVDMIPAICKLSSGVSIIDLSHGIYDQDLLPKSNLRHIMFRSDQYTDAQMELVRRNSQSLECIHLVNIDTAACLKLIQDPIGNPVVYPHVWKLELFVKTKLDAMTFPSPLSTPFPSLIDLACTGMYPFSNDCLLRGNKQTLVRLALPVTVHLVETLDDITDYTGLKDVSLYWRGRSNSNREQVAEQTIALVFKISATIERIELDVEYTTDYGAILRIARESLVAQTLQILDVISTPLTYIDVIQLITLLPNLARLSLMLAHEDPLNIRQRISADVIQQVHSENYPVNARRLYLLRVVSLFGMNFNHMAERIILLCTLIPSVKRAVVSLDRRVSNFEELANKLLKRKGFREHGNRLSGVKFSEVK